MTQDRLDYRVNMGETPPGRILVESHALDMPRRLREIDPGYFILFNPENQRYELHHEEQETTYCLTFPFSELDGRAEDYTREMRIERIKDIYSEIKAHNEKVERDKQQKFDDDVEWVAREIHRSALRRNEVPDEDAYKTRWA